ncbi:hypothetical protein Tsp_15954, partial [Trichinella spiralis]|uniref:hypothetical protein n=1 Tax=Trichinella spiralis TaxID=6334 RepID=UPI0001EFD8CB
CGLRHPMNLVPFATRVHMDVKALPNRPSVPLLITNSQRRNSILFMTAMKDSQPMALSNSVSYVRTVKTRAASECSPSNIVFMLLYANMAVIWYILYSPIILIHGMFNYSLGAVHSSTARSMNICG